MAMMTINEPNAIYFQKLENIRQTKECIICNNKLKNTGVYFARENSAVELIFTTMNEMSENHDNHFVCYSLGCECCYAVYSSNFRIISMDYTRVSFFS